MQKCQSEELLEKGGLREFDGVFGVIFEHQVTLCQHALQEQSEPMKLLH